MLVSFGTLFLAAFFSVLPLGGSLAMWYAQGTVSEHGATVAVSAQGPNHVYTGHRWSFWVSVLVLALNESAPFEAVAVNVTEVRLEEIDAAASHRWTPQGAMSLTEGARWNETFNSGIILYSGGSEYVLQVDVQMVVVWQVITSSGAAHRVEYWSPPFHYDFHYEQHPPPIIPGFPFEAIYVGIALVLVYFLVYRRFSDSHEN